MQIRQVELKKISIKSLISLDKSIKLEFIINLNSNNDIQLDLLKQLIYKPLILDIKEDME